MLTNRFSGGCQKIERWIWKQFNILKYVKLAVLPNSDIALGDFFSVKQR